MATSRKKSKKTSRAKKTTPKKRNNKVTPLRTAGSKLDLSIINKKLDMIIENMDQRLKAVGKALDILVGVLEATAKQLDIKFKTTKTTTTKVGDAEKTTKTETTLFDDPPAPANGKSALTKEEVTQALQEVFAQEGKSTVAEILKSFGVKKVSDISESDYEKVVASCGDAIATTGKVESKEETLDSLF